MECYDTYDAQGFVLVDKETDAVKFIKTPSPKITSPISPKSPSQAAVIKPAPTFNSKLSVQLKFDDESINCQQFKVPMKRNFLFSLLIEFFILIPMVQSVFSSAL